MKLSHYIKELLFEHEYVIIPGFGAFVSHYKPAFYDEVAAIFHPPSKEVTFSAQLKNNDGLLIKYVSETEGVTDFSASKKIEKERESIQYKLDNGEKVEIVGVGTLYIDEKKQVCFNSAPEDNLLIDSFGLEATSLRENEVKEEARKKEVVIAEKPRKKRKLAWMWLILIPVALIVVFVYLNYIYPPINGVPSDTPKIKDDITYTKSETIITDSAKADSLVADTTMNLQDTTPQPVEEVKEPEAEEGPFYYLIGGGFSQQENADKYFNELQNAGYQPVQLGKIGRLFMVAIGKYNTFQEAKKVQLEFREREPNSEVWIKKQDN